MAAQARADELLGQPTPGAIDLQRSASPLRDDVMFFHNDILLPIITLIVLFVLALLLICIVKFNKRANPTPARWSHNTVIEVIWTGVPVLILMFIAIFSFKLLFKYHDMPQPYMTVKATGYQWYWGYAYPDQKIDEITSTITPEAKTTPELYRLAADNPMVVPVGQVVRVLVTGADVIHSFSVPAFGVKIDAIPGRVNETWFKAEQTGQFYGQCSQLCGINHAFMPIQVNVVSQADFNAWVASKQPKPAVAAPALTPAAAPAAPTPAKTAVQTNAVPGAAAKPAVALASLNRPIGKE
ncbi:MAG TPA: cytochrome c oxidase subunit II [Caulobacteraceae bacterium]|nr:cytochrome c oxidase subunit II [Caulobacteraceae bacterium]